MIELQSGMTLGMLRELLGLSQKEFAERAGISQSHASKIEGKPFNELRIRHIQLYTKVLGLQFVIKVEPQRSNAN